MGRARNYKDVLGNGNKYAYIAKFGDNKVIEFLVFAKVASKIEDGKEVVRPYEPLRVSFEDFVGLKTFHQFS